MKITNITVVKYINKTFEEENALAIDDKVILHGDYYHDKINEMIDGFIMGLEYCGYVVDMEEVDISPDNEMFETIGFYNDSEFIKDDDESSEEKTIESTENNQEIQNTPIEEINMNYHFYILHYEFGKREIYTQDVIEAVKYASNFEADLYDVDRLIFSPLGLDFDYNNELLREYGVEFTSEDDEYASLRTIQ